MSDAQGAREPRPRHRPSSLTREVISKLGEALAAGAYFKDACEYAGIDRATGHRWIVEAEQEPPDPADFTNAWVTTLGDTSGDAWEFVWTLRSPENPEPLPGERLVDVQKAWEKAIARYELVGDFRDARVKGQSQAKVVALARIKRAGANGAWQADAWWLERAFPDEYGRNRVEVVGKDGGAMQVAVSRDSIEALLANPAAVAAAQTAALDPFRTMGDE